MDINNLELSLDKKKFEKEHLNKRFMELYKLQIEILYLLIFLQKI